ncbi:MAG TPA: hypothetical protein VHE60_08430 [Pyrinomonadaceae bacterium]|nr:hypothetical protein [Pyrinomonadaceae bacterium]
MKEAAVSAWDDNATVGAQVQLANDGPGPAYKLRLTKVEVQGGTYAGPAGLPTASLGNLAAGADNIKFDALLKVPADGSARILAVEGSYVAEKDEDEGPSFRAERTISPNTTPPGPVTGVTGQTTKQNPNTATYPPAPPSTHGHPNSETPVFVPIGPSRQIFPPTPNGTALGTSAGAANVQIPVNTSMTSAGVPPDPNAAAATAGGVVLATYNTGISVSTNGGVNFTDVNLSSPQPGNPARTSFFPQSDGGLCCDQVVIYIPNQNIFVWLLQYWPAVTPPNTITQARLRIAWATPAAITSDFWNAWTYGDLNASNTPGVSSGLGIASNEWLDYPDLAFSNTFLYVGVDRGWPNGVGSVYLGRRLVARLSLADMVNPASSVVNYGFGELTGSNGLNKSHFVQGAPGRMVVGSLDNSSTLRVFTWADNEGNIRGASTVAISQIQQGANYTSIAPDTSDWLAVSFPGNITGGVYRNVAVGLGAPSREEYVFAFDAGTNPGGGRAQAYLRLETLTPNGNNYNASSEYDVWNSAYAYAMGGLGTDGNEIGITLAVGGGTVIGYPQFAVGYKDDFVVYQVTNSNATQTVRFGDYVPNRPIAGGLFATEVYDVILNPLPAGVASGTCATIGCTARMRFVEYGRPPGPPIK